LAEWGIFGLDARRYFSAVERLVNVVLRPLPSRWITGITASAIPAAIKPYSIAVAPLSSFKNLMTKRMNISSENGVFIQ
jgi:hypothetical protein